VPIPAALRDHLVERKLEHGADTRVFGGANKARKMVERGTAAMRKAKLEPLAIHDARHTYASLMIAAGVNAKALSEFMGHATIAITCDLYEHLMPGSHDEAAGLLDAFPARAADAHTDARLQRRLQRTPHKRARERDCSRGAVLRRLAGGATSAARCSP
jgi:Phage integrase family